MDSDSIDDSVFDDAGDDSEAYTPVKTKTKAAPKTAMTKTTAKPKKMVQSKLNMSSTASKKRPKLDPDDDAVDNAAADDADDSLLDSSPSPKRPKMSASKKSNGKPLAEIGNGAMDDEPVKPASKTKKTATEKYQKLTQLEHIIKRPDTYIGSVEQTTQRMWVFNKETQQMENRMVTFVPGLYKIFDEILVNAADNKQQDPSMSYMKVTVDRAEGQVTVENNGKAIPVEIHEKEKCYIPEMVFGHLLSGSNYDDNEKKTVGGRNGYGAKLCNVFSTKFTVEVQDSAHGKRYQQTWTDNMSKMQNAKITSNKSSDFVRVSFKPDLEKFRMPNGIDDDLEALINRRVYDMAGTVAGVKVTLNGEHIKLDFKKYCAMYAKAIASERGVDTSSGVLSETATVQFEDAKNNRRWQIGFTVSDGAFQQVSFVNSIATTSGGTHVTYVADQVCDALLKDLNRKKKGHSLKMNHIKNQIFLFVSCLIDNPAFTSQTKEQLTTRPSAFGSKYQISDAFIKKIKQTDAINNIMRFAEHQADKMLAKSDGTRRSRISNDKLVDANLAGTRHGHECTLILTEGDSARGLAVAGRAVLDPDRIGVFPLRGKMLNVRDATLEQITKNKEIQNIKQFLGLKHKQVYTDTKSLRYGHLMIMADQDHDGSHIKGLLINFLQVQYPSLLQIPDFFREFITPVVKVWQGPNPKKPQRLRSFFNLPQYEEWKEVHKVELGRWHFKYFKGLGTSSNEDAQVYFSNLDEHLKEFHTMKSEEAELFDLAFSKKKADARKEWLGNFVPGTYLDHTIKSITYSDFVNKELILFSMADNMRSIPSMVDGLKPGQRKVIYACLKRNLTKDKKVIELAGYVSEQTFYHHGEASLQQTIVGLAQNFVGSNNINILEPSGNFGSRLAGGSDAASARYIHTRLSPFARKIFSPLDEPNLEHQYEEGKMIEPKTYAPIIPMVLVNGADGIGTGWSTSIPNYHPLDIVMNLRRRMGRLENSKSEGEPFEPMTPWFRGWKGTPEPDGPTKFKFNGIATQDDKNPNEAVVTELPIRMWTDDFKAKLEEILRAEKTPSFIKDYKEFNDHKNVHFVIQLDEKHKKSALDESLIEKFKLSRTINLTNLVAFNTRGQIRRYEKPEDVMEEFYHYRLGMYSERKKHWLGVYHADYRKLKSQARFIEEIMEGKLVVSKKKKAIVVQELRDHKYEAFPPGQQKKYKNTDEDIDKEESEEEEGADTDARDFDYLLSMPIWSFTAERLERLRTQIAAKKVEHDELEALDEKDLWSRDLDDFVQEWENQMKLDAEIQTNIRRLGRRVSRKIGAGKGRRVKAEDDDFDPGAKKARAPKAAKAEPKTHQRFGEMFSNTKPRAAPVVTKKEDLSDGDFVTLAKPKSSNAATKASAATAPKEAKNGPTKRVAASKIDAYMIDLSDQSDEDFASLGQPAAKPSAPPPKSEEEVPAVVAGGRAKRAAAAKTKSWTLDDSSSDSDEAKESLDVDAYVRGIGDALGSNDDKSKQSSMGQRRLSLFSMSRPRTAQGESSAASLAPKSKGKSTRNFDIDSNDETNYEALAASSPLKPPPSRGGTTSAAGTSRAKENGTGDDYDIDSFLSDDDLAPPKPSKTTTAARGKTADSTAPNASTASSTAETKKPRGRTAGATNKAKNESAASPKPRKASRAKKTGKAAAAKRAFSGDDGGDDLDVLTKDKSTPMDVAGDEDETEMPVARARSGRPGRAAATKKKPVYRDFDDDDEDDDSMILVGAKKRGKDEDESDDFMDSD